MENIIAHLAINAKKYGNKVAIYDQRNSITYSDLKNEVLKTALYFKQKGIKAGDRVLVFVPVSIDLYRILLALFYIGATAVFLDEWVSKKRMELCCKIAQCKGFIGITKAYIFSFFSKELRKIPIKLSVNHGVNKLYKESYYADSGATALITFTTGSTGTPKAAKRTHLFLLHQYHTIVKEIQLKPEDIDMPFLPIFVLCNLAMGCTTVLPSFNGRKPETLKPDKIIKEIQTHKVNRIISSPFIVKKLSEYSVLHNINLTSIKKIFTGGAPIFPSEALLYQKAFPDIEINILYGSTEAEPISAITVKELLSSDSNAYKEGLPVGHPVPEIELAIISYDDHNIKCDNENKFKSLILSPGSIGEIVVAGDHVLKEYYNNEEALKRNKIFVGDKIWHRTGDSGYLNSKGELFLCGRCKQLIYFNDKIIAPFLYESFLQSLSSVSIGTVLMLNKKLTITIELKNSNARKETIKLLKSSSLLFDDIMVIKKIPRDPRHNSKIDYTMLSQYIENKELTYI